jgi:hypothetical protein
MDAAHVACKGGTKFVIVPTPPRCLDMIVAVGMGDISQVVLTHRPRIGSVLQMLFAHKVW